MAKKQEEEKRKNPLAVLLKAEWQNLGDRRPAFMLYMFMFVIAGILSLMTPLIIGLVFNSVQQNINSEAELWRLIFLISTLLVIDILFWMFHGTSRYMEMKNGFLVTRNYTNSKIQKVLDLPVSWHKDHHSGDTIDKINKASGALNSFAQHVTFQLVYAVISLVGSVVILAFFNWKIALVAFIFSICVLYIMIRIDRILVKKYKASNKLENKASAAIFDYVSNIITVITLRLKKTVRKEIDHKIMASYGLHKEGSAINEVKWGFASISISVIVVVLLSYKAYTDYHLNGIILVGSLYILFGYLKKMGDTFYSLAHLYGEIVRYGANIENAEPIDEAYDEVKEKLSGKLTPSWKEVQLRNIDFTYNVGDKKSHIDNVNFSLKRGERIALVGESGSGKSTMLSLLRGLYDADSGKVYQDGKFLKNSLHHLQEHVTLIPQDPEIFNNTIKFNITMGIPYKQADVTKAIKMAQLSKVIQRLDKGLKTSVMEKGVSLSGGEKQRLALARGLLAARSSDIILMDEPTSSVDSMNEVKIHDNVFKEFKDKTIISSIHRLHLLDKFDTIYFFESGKIVASGTLRDMKKNLKFKRLLDKYKNSDN